MNRLPVLLLVFSAVFMACNGGNSSTSRQTEAAAEKVKAPIQIPEFNADSAYHYIEKQVLFGPRVPNTKAHQLCGDWLHATLNRFADTVYVQSTRVRAYDGTVLSIRNFIGSFQPENPNRILLCAHWDSRPGPTMTPTLPTISHR